MVWPPAISVVIWLHVRPFPAWMTAEIWDGEEMKHRGRAIRFLLIRALVLPYYQMQTISFKVSDDEARLIRSLAKKQRTSLSEYLRRQAKAAPQSSEPPQRVRCEYTGAMIFAPLSGQKPLTTGTVREMLSDFP